MRHKGAPSDMHEKAFGDTCAWLWQIYTWHGKGELMFFQRFSPFSHCQTTSDLLTRHSNSSSSSSSSSSKTNSTTTDRDVVILPGVVVVAGAVIVDVENATKNACN